MTDFRLWVGRRAQPSSSGVLRGECLRRRLCLFGFRMTVSCLVRGRQGLENAAARLVRGRAQSPSCWASRSFGRDDAPPAQDSSQSRARCDLGRAKTRRKSTPSALKAGSSRHRRSHVALRSQVSRARLVGNARKRREDLCYITSMSDSQSASRPSLKGMPVAVSGGASGPSTHLHRLKAMAQRKYVTTIAA